MGDRANVVIRYKDEQVCLYTHWGGSELPDTLRAALKRGESRLDDFQYLTRIIFCEMINGDCDGITGYGITQKVWDGHTRVITVDADAGTVAIGDKTQTIAEFVAGSDGWGDD